MRFAFTQKPEGMAEPMPTKILPFSFRCGKAMNSTFLLILALILLIFDAIACFLHLYNQNA